MDNLPQDTPESKETLSPESFAILQKLFSSLLIGFIFATLLYGATILQVYTYCTRAAYDRKTIQALVAILFVLDTLSTGLISHSIHTYFVTNLGNPAASLTIPLSFAIETTIVSVIVFVAQGFYCYQTWRLSHNHFIVGAILVTSIAAFGTALALGGDVIKDDTIFVLNTPHFKLIASLSAGFAVISDTLIVAAMIYYLHGSFKVLRRSSELVNTLIIYAFSRGILMTVTQFSFIVLFALGPLTLPWLPFHQMVPKLHVNAVLMTLNLRTSLRQSMNEPESIHLSDVRFAEEFNEANAISQAQRQSSMNMRREESEQVKRPVEVGSLTATTNLRVSDKTTGSGSPSSSILNIPSS